LTQELVRKSVLRLNSSGQATTHFDQHAVIFRLYMVHGYNCAST